MTKLEKIEAINADLQAGRVFIGIDLGFEPTIPGIEQRCARCGVQIDDLAAHQERCFVVGDWVRWEYRSHWSEGELRCHMPDGVADVRVATSSQYRDVGKMTSMLVCNIRRIPRPGQERHRPGCPSSVLNNDPRCVPPSVLGCACSRPLPGYPEAKYYPPKPGETLSKAKIDAKRTGQEVAMDHYCRGCGLECAWSAISDGVYCNPCRAKSGMPALPRKHGPGGRGVAGPCDPDCAKCAVEQSPPTAPTLYDGLTAEQCLERFIWLQRDAKDTPLAGTHRRDALTESQRNIARFLWSTQLRAKIAASRSAGRNQVVLEQDGADFEW